MRIPKILGVTGTPRSKDSGQGIKRIVSDVKDEYILNEVIEKLARDQALSNSEICLMAALFGVKKAGLDFDAVNLKDYVEGPSIINADKLEKIVRSSDGIIMATPVYFGDRSYLLDKFMEFLKRRSLFKGKIIGCLSVGAKRNGGQETTNIYIIKEATDAGAYAVGNGPPSSQYGGTAWAGDMGAIREDVFGITTSMGTGRRVARIASLLAEKGDFTGASLRVAFWVLRDMRGVLLREIERLNEYARKNLNFNIDVDIVNFLEMDFRTCLACAICPFRKDEKTLYKCRIRYDDFEKEYGRLVNTDAVVVSGYNPGDMSGVNDIYLKALERTRCIRRDNFLLTDVPVTSFSIEELTSRSLFHIRAVTAFLRHNSVIHQTMTTYMEKEKRVSAPEKTLLDFMNFAMNIKKAKEVVKEDQSPVYIPVGYTAAAHGEREK